MAIRLRTLGSFSVLVNGVESPEMRARPVRMALLVFLGVEREASRERVMALLWPESDHDHARQALRQTLYALRQDLGHEWLESDRDTLRATPVLAADVTEMLEAVNGDRPAEASALYQGDFLEGFLLAESQPFQLWCDQWRARLKRLNRTARRSLIDEQVADGNLSAGLDEARRWLDLDPLEDEAQHRVIEILFRLRRGEEALREYESFEALLAREGLEPLEDTRALVEKIRSSGASIPPLHERPVGINASPAARGQKGSRIPGRKVLLPVLLITSSIAIAASLFFRGTTGTPDGPGTDPTRIMVLPLTNETGDSTLDVVGILASEWITHAIVHMGSLQAVPSLDVLQMLEAGLSGERAAGERGAGILVSGRYFQVGDSLALHAQITDLARGEFWDALGPFWAPADDPRTGLQELRDRIGGSLAVRFIPDAALPDPSVLNPPNYQAFQAVLDASGFVARGDWAGALPHVERAVRLDPTFYRAHLYMAAAFLNLDRPDRADSVLTALAPDRHRFSPYERLVFQSGQAALRGDWVGRLAASREAARIDPGGTLHYISAGVAMAAGRPGEALDLFANLDPHCPWAPERIFAWADWTAAHHLLGKHRQELEEARRARSHHPNQLEALFLEVRALAALGRLDELRRLLSQAPNLPPHGRWDVGHLLLRTGGELRAHGHPELASELLSSASDWHRSQPEAESALYSHRVDLADVHFLAGRSSEASRVLEDLSLDYPEDIELLGRRGALAARLGNEAAVLGISASLKAKRKPYSFGAVDYWLSVISAWSGAEDQALLHLQHAIDEGRPRGIALHADPFLEPLWLHPSFALAVAEEG